MAIRYRGARLLNHPLHNKSTAFTCEEREALGLEGLLPDVVTSVEQQMRRVYWNISRKADDLEKYIGLAALQDRNEHLLPPGRALDLAAAVRALKPTILIGATGAPGTFTEPVVREMAAHAGRPVILPLSNPTSCSEARPADLLAWTGGRALVATGSPFAPVRLEGRAIRVAQANNAFIFPGVGLGTLVAEAREVTDGMLLAAAERLAEETAARAGGEEALFPTMAALRAVSARVAEAVVREARSAGLGLDLADERIPTAVTEQMWEPVYPSLQPY